MSYTSSIFIGYKTFSKGTVPSALATGVKDARTFEAHCMFLLYGSA